MPPKPFEQETVPASVVRLRNVEPLATPTNVAPDSFVPAVVSAAKRGPAYEILRLQIVAW